MDQDDRQQANDDIAHLKEHLGDAQLQYHDISLETELQAIIRRWPLIAESEAAGKPGRAPRA